jgi:hypothetical protein
MGPLSSRRKTENPGMKILGELLALNLDNKILNIF